MALEFAADASVNDAYPLPLQTQDSPVVADWEPLVRASWPIVGGCAGRP